MTPHRSTAFLAAALLALYAPGLAGQESPLILEVHGGLAAPIGSFRDGSGDGEGAAPGASLSVDFVLTGQGRRGLYAGFSQHRFGCEDAGCSAGGRYVATGFDVGFRFKLRREGDAIPWIRIGGITTRMETDDLGGANVGVSDLGFGGEVGAGVHIGGASPLAISPGVRFAAVSSTLPGGSSLGLRYLVVQVAAVLAF